MVPAFVWLEQVAAVAERSPEPIDSSGFSLAQVRLDLGKACSMGFKSGL
jgi:hypothetical protein